MLSTNGHIAALVNPPGNEKSAFQIADEHPADPEEWLAAASQRRGSWWDDWSAWLGERSGEERKAPKALGSKQHVPLQDAPGTYVFESV